jgi:hypothetical protein
MPSLSTSRGLAHRESHRPLAHPARSGHAVDDAIFARRGRLVPMHYGVVTFGTDIALNEWDELYIT